MKGRTDSLLFTHDPIFNFLLRDLSATHFFLCSFNSDRRRKVSDCFSSCFLPLSSASDILNGSAVCVYRMEDVVRAFKGNFLHKEGPQYKWAEFTGKVPYPRPGTVSSFCGPPPSACEHLSADTLQSADILCPHMFLCLPPSVPAARMEATAPQESILTTLSFSAAPTPCCRFSQFQHLSNLTRQL